jgi:hypothetical protein
MADQNDRFAWTTGGDKALIHKRLIDAGGSGVVHEVCLLIAVTDKASFTTSNPGRFI